MRGSRGGMAAACVALMAMAAILAARAGNLRAQRSSALDLELGGELKGLPPGSTRFVTREDLLALPQVTYTVTDDSNFTGPAEIKGVLLEELARDLGAAPRADLVVAICDDKYRANYPRDYMRAHHPMLVLEINGKPPAAWPRSGEGFEMGPYMISHAKFTPAFKILAHGDEPQIPWGVVRLEFRAERAVFGAIAPRGPHANDADVQDGYRIAQQNCFRCHNAGDEGGQKSGVTWTVLAALAAGSPEFFAEYVRNPKTKNPKTQMAASPQYDDVTMQALTDYFQTFAPAEKP